MSHHNLEQYVAGRYMHDLNQTGYQPFCHEADEMIQDALKIMAALNQASHFIKRNVAQRKATT